MLFYLFNLAKKNSIQMYFSSAVSLKKSVYNFSKHRKPVRFLVICSQRKIKTFIISLNHVRDFKFHDVTLHVFL